jgi:hypothetical protein
MRRSKRRGGIRAGRFKTIAPVLAPTPRGVRRCDHDLSSQRPRRADRRAPLDRAGRPARSRPRLARVDPRGRTLLQDPLGTRRDLVPKSNRIALKSMESCTGWREAEERRFPLNHAGFGALPAFPATRLPCRRSWVRVPSSASRKSSVDGGNAVVVTGNAASSVAAVVAGPAANVVGRALPAHVRRKRARHRVRW